VTTVPAERQNEPLPFVAVSARTGSGVVDQLPLLSATPPPLHEEGDEPPSLPANRDLVA
jgi:hypothetical protein